MIGTCPSVTQNASYDPRTLAEVLQELEVAIRPESRTTLPQLQALLSETYTRLCEHIREKEHTGAAEAPADTDPRFEHETQTLCEEHRQLRQSLDALHGEAIVSDHFDRSIAAKIEQWIRRMRDHELRENDFIQDAVDVDLGAQD